MMMITSLIRRVLGSIPPALSSKLHVTGLVSLGAWLVLLPLLGIAHPSTYAQLLGGNYTNIISALGSAIAAGGVVHIAQRQDHHTWNLEDLRDSLMRLHHKHNRLANQVAPLVGAQQQPAPAAPATNTMPPATDTAPPAAPTR